MDKVINVTVVKNIRLQPTNNLLTAGTKTTISEQDLNNYPEAFSVDTPPKASNAPGNSTPPEKEPDLITPASSSRPNKTASITVWREYADSLGIETKGLNKQQLIAATRNR